MTGNGAHLRLHEVSVRYGALTALDNVSLEIQAGELLALVGPSGAGKTSLLKLFNGAVRPHQGQVSINGNRLGDMSTADFRSIRAATGFIHQDLSLIPNIRVLQNVVTGRLGQQSLAASARDFLFPSRATTNEVYRILERVGIADKIYQQTDRLSGGQQQRVAIARALYQRPRVLLCDEPVSSVDPSRAAALLELLQGLCRDRGLTLCVSLHNLDLARKYFPRLVALREGGIVFDKQTHLITPDEFEQVYRLQSMGHDSPGGIDNADAPLHEPLGARFG